MKSLFFTLCSNNYLPFAFSLGKSVKAFEPDARFVIGLVDRFDSQIDYTNWNDFEFLACFDLEYAEFGDMLSRYNIIEFNTAVKPFYFEYLFTKYPNVDQIFYLDPDLYFYQNPRILDFEWGDNQILLTPNLIYKTNQPSSGELASLRHGVNNLGFIGIKRGKEAFELIEWWKQRLINHCRIDKCYGIFVDQKWIDLVPLFFDKVKSVKHPGWNMAWWNFSERKLFKKEDCYYVNNEKYPLVFFHFSGFKPEKYQTTERWDNEEFAIKDDSPLHDLYESYRMELIKNRYEDLSVIKPSLAFFKTPNGRKHQIGRFIKSKMNNLLYRFFKV